MGLWPRKQPDDILESLEELVELFSAVMDYYRENMKDLKSSSEHDGCHIGDLYARASEMIYEIEAPVLEVHIKHMESQRLMLESEPKNSTKS